MKRVALVAWLAPVLLLAQTEPQRPPETVTRIVRVQYGNPETIAHLASAGLHARADADNTLRAIVVKGEPGAVAEVERIAHELDVPASVPVSKDVEITVSVLGASTKPGAFAQAEVPENLTSVVKQIGAIFPYKSYALLSSMLMRSREGGKSENQGVMEDVSGGTNRPYKLAYDEARVSTVDGKPILHLRGFRFVANARIAPGSPTSGLAEISVQTDVDLREGEKVVVGKANTGDSDSALFVILSGRLVD